MCDIGANYIKTIKATTLFVVFLFVHSWEQRKVSELFRVTRGYVLAATQTETTKTDEKPYPVYSSQTKDKGLMGYYKDYLYEDAITWTTDGANAGTVNYRAGKFYCTNVCGVLLSNEVKANQMIAEALNSVTKGYVSYVGNPKLMNNVMADIVIQIPTQAEEREQLSSFFSKLDNLITLHQRKDFSRFSQILRRKKHSFFPISWEQRKLGEIGSVSMCRRIFKEQTSETGDIPFYKIGTFGAKPDAFISRELFEEYKSKYPYPKKGDILISASGSIGRTVEFAGNNEYFQDSNIVWLSHDERLSNSFLKCFYSVVKWAGIEGSTIKRLYNDNILNTVICMPSVPEQERIGLFFENLDNLITLHQRECFYIYKKYLLFLEMQNSHKRNYSWEQRKLGDLVKEVTRRDPNSNAPIMMITANNGFIEQSERYAFNNAGESLKKYILLQKGELAYNHGASKLRPYGSCFALTTAENARIPFVYHCFSAERMNHEFLSIELNGNEIESQLRSIVSSGARMDGLLNISFGEYTSVSILFPKKNEQDKIADFFRQLDNLITLHQCESCKKVAAVQSAFARRNLSKWADSWEQRKLGDITQIIMGQSPDGSTYSDFPTDYILVQGNADLENGWVKPRIWTTQKTKYAVAGDLIMSVRAPAGSMGKTAYNVVLGRGVAAIKGNEFIFQVLTKMDLEGFWKKLSAGSTFESLNSDNIINANINLPSNLEQDKIGSIFENIDNLITLHQCKVFYKNIIFNNIKFGGLETENNTSWEQRKLGEVSESYSGGTPSVGIKEYYGGQIPFIRSAEINSETTELFLTEEGLKNSSARLVAVGDILYALYGATSGEVGRARLKGAINQAILAIKPNKDYDSEYLAQWLRKSKHRIIETYLQGGQGNLSGAIVKELSADFPSLKEQKTIGDFFRQLDNLITLHQRIKIFFTGDYHDKKNK